MQYSDFSSLLVLAIGCNLIYIVNRDNGNNGLSFFLFLRLINNTQEKIEKLREAYAPITVILDKLKNIKEEKTLKEIEDIYGQEDSLYILKNKDIKPPFSKVEIYEKIINFFAGTNQLQSITLITFLYSFFVALLAPYELYFFNELFLQMNIAILLFSVILLICGVAFKEKTKKQERILFFLIVICSTILFLKDCFTESIINTISFFITII